MRLAYAARQPYAASLCHVAPEPRLRSCYALVACSGRALAELVPRLRRAAPRMPVPRPCSELMPRLRPPASPRARAAPLPRLCCARARAPR